MNDNAPIRPAWTATFLAALTETGMVRKAARTARIIHTTAYDRRKRDPRFAAEWLAALAHAKERSLAATPAVPGHQWRRPFLEALAETSNVTAAAARASVPPATAYKLRRDDPRFAARWLAALHEGYDNLEMELLGYLRDAEPGRKMDVAAALRLLAAHRQTVERRRALAEEEEEQAVFASIDAFIEDMRQRRLANAAILAEGQADDGAE